MSVFMLAIVLIPRIGVYVNGARRWINLGFTNFQPSELAKILLIIFFAKFIMEHKEDLSRKADDTESSGFNCNPACINLKRA